jgi:hypothetical protein
LPPIGLHEAVRVEVLSPPQAAICGEVVELCGNRLQLRLPEPLAPGHTVKVQGQQCLLLGEVLFCGPGSGGQLQGWLVGIQVEHALGERARVAPFWPDPQPQL